MKLQSIKILNFRGIAEIEFKTDRDICVIVGPNAMGKTSIFQAIRLAKSVLAPRFPEETTHTVRDLGGMFLGTNALNYPALAGDITKGLEITLLLTLSQGEIELLKKQSASLAAIHTRNQVAIPPTVDDLAFVQFLSSPVGKQLHDQSQKDITEKISQLQTSTQIKISLTANPDPSSVRGGDLMSQEIVMVLEKLLPPTMSLLSYFPADRAMPTGEVGIQIGSADAQGQIYSHLALPGTKYSRLKNFLLNQSLQSADASKSLQEDFALIFNSLLPGKNLKSISISPHSLLSVLIEDLSTKKIFDIDHMSSGEKGLILQFLLMRRSVSNGGLLLIDEPELHLNPSICRRFIAFLSENVLSYNHTQALICTHSPEILAEAFERDTCRLFHLRSPKDISPVHKNDKGEVFEALRRLGAQTADVLFSKGTIFVEGAHDAELLQVGFNDQLSGFRLTHLRGRSEVEKEIKYLQNLELAGKLDGVSCFIFDGDRKPTELQSSALVRIRQWDRYCFENYLLESDCIFEVLKGQKGSIEITRGSIRPHLKSLALSQIPAISVRQIYRDMEPDNPGLRPDDTQSGDYNLIAQVLFDRLEKIRTQLAKIEKSQWIADVASKCNGRAEEINRIWDEKWQNESDGKKLLSDYHKDIKINISLIDFKKQILAAMKNGQTENWRIVKSYLNDLLQ